MIKELTCIICHKTFYLDSQFASRAKYCSKDCHQKYIRDNQVHKKGKLVECVCEACGKTFRVRYSVAKVQKYCSQACMGNGREWTGSKNPKWKPKITVTCEYCGKEFETYPSRLGRRKYCCKEHRALGNLERLASGKRTDIEIAMAKALQSNKIAFDEQVIMFNKFIVDFLLRDHPVIIQCDGIYWHNKPNVKSRDRGQDKYLAKVGFTVLRFTNKEIGDDLQDCISKIKSHLR